MNRALLVRPYSSSTSSSIKKSAKLIRNEFLDYFKGSLGHTFVRSSPVTPLNDQTIAFVNAGMNQFKGVFLNYHDPPATKVTNSQKCIRISGKHNDLDVVGNDTYHHTFFEMLGNWSFGDYFKKEACLYAWDLLTKHYGLKKDLLYITYFGGNEQLGLEPDLECKDIWLSIGVAKDKVLPFNMKDNFWEMGVNGPCGPCTEIHIDHRRRGSNQSMRVNKGYADLTELWNIVFIQYERLANGTIVPLPKYHVDTGMGLERLVALLQEKTSNYDTDLFQPLFKAIQKYTKAPEYKGEFFNDEYNLDSAYRILADHSRMITVALADGAVLEKNNKLRKIIRKAIDVGERVFKKENILLELSYAVADNLGDVYPELQTNLKKVQKIIEFEKELFKRLRVTSGKEWNKIVEIRPELASVTDWTAPGLLSGYKYLQNTLKNLITTKTLPGNVAFKLYDTYGLSEETINELAEIESLNLDTEAFQNELQNIKYQSKIGLNRKCQMHIKGSIDLLEKSHIPKTDDTLKYEYVFVENDYRFPTIESKVVGLIINGNLMLNNKNGITNENTKLEERDEIGVILDRTLCYSLEGGQISDCGTIYMKDLILHINNVVKMNNYVIHICNVNLKDLDQKLKIGDNCMVSIDSNHRKGLMQHHTAAHLLSASLRQTIQAIYPRDSLIFPHTLKLQCTSFGEKLSLEKLKKIEKSINNVIQTNAPVKIKVLNSSELLAEDFVTVIPGEIYPYTGIRIVEIDTCTLKSKEACCGTHVHRTGVLEHFCFLSYSSKGAANFTVNGAVGSFAKSAKIAGENIQRKILNLDHKLTNDQIGYEAFELIYKEIKNELKDNTKKTPIPYIVREECLKQLEDLNKNTWIQTKEAEKSAINLEVKGTNSTSSFIVHCLYKNPKCLSLQEIISIYLNTPTLIILYHNETIRARCFVPQEIASDTFNAQTWMKVVLEIFKAEYGPIRGFNAFLVANMKSITVSQISSENLIPKAINAAKDFASRSIQNM